MHVKAFVVVSDDAAKTFVAVAGAETSLASVTCHVDVVPSAVATFLAVAAGALVVLVLVVVVVFVAGIGAVAVYDAVQLVVVNADDVVAVVVVARQLVFAAVVRA